MPLHLYNHAFDLLLKICNSDLTLIFFVSHASQPIWWQRDPLLLENELQFEITTAAILAIIPSFALVGGEANGAPA